MALKRGSKERRAPFFILVKVYLSPDFEESRDDVGANLGLSITRDAFANSEVPAALFGRAITDNCRQAALMGQLVEEAPELELAVPVISNICCFYPGKADPADIAARLQTEGTAVFSTGKVADRPCLRAAIVNHRTTGADIRAAIDAVRAAIA